MKHRLSIVLAATALAAAVLGPAAAAATEPYVPFVTDFPAPEAVAKPEASPVASSTDWGDVGLGAGVGAALVVLLAASRQAVARRTGAAQS